MTEPRRIELGIDGSAAFALLGDDIQSGECVFVDVLPDKCPERLLEYSQMIAAKVALRKLREKLGQPEHPYYFGKSHPYGSDC